MLLHEAVRLFLMADRRPATNASYAKTLAPFARAVGPDRPLANISPEDLDAYVMTLRRRTEVYAGHPLRPTEGRPLSAASVYKHIKTLKTFFYWCLERELLAVSPARFLSTRRPGRPLGQGKAATDPEVETLLAAARFRPRELALIMLLAKSGCRAGEAARLRLADLDLEGHCAWVDGKGGRRRKIYFDEETSQVLGRWLDLRAPASHDCVFCSRHGGAPLTAQAVSQVIRRLCKLAGIRSLGAHALRHRVGLKFARARVAPRVAQHYLGHTDITITLAYYQDVDESDLFEAGSLL